MSDLPAGDFPERRLDAWLDPASLSPLVGEPERVELLTHNPLNAVTGGIWRVVGPRDSVIVKVITDGRRHDGPDWWAASRVDHHWNSWRREVLVYRTGLPSLYEPDGLGAPELRASHDLDDGTAVLVLEDVAGRTGSALTVDDLVDLAGALGRAQGRLAARGDWDRPFLSRSFLREYSRSKPVDDELLASDAAWSHPRVAAHLAPLREPLTRLRAQWSDLVAIAEAAPSTLCHLDVWPANVVRRADGRFALLDWAFCGRGALGEDVANLVPDSVFDLLVPATAVDELAARAEAAYLAGVRDGGWRGHDDAVRLGLRAAAVKYHWLAARLLADPDAPVRYVYGGRAVDADDYYAARAAGLRVLCHWAEDALRAVSDR